MPLVRHTTEAKINSIYGCRPLNLGGWEVYVFVCVCVCVWRVCGSNLMKPTPMEASE